MSMSGYTKLFNSILASTIWREDDKTRLVWITLLAMADKNGIAEGSLPGLADMARVSISDCKMALEKLKSPDEYSRSRENEGRRIEQVEGGWAIINHSKYRAKMSTDERREYNRVKQQEFRQKKSMTVNDESEKSALSAHTKAEAEASPKAEANNTETKEDPAGSLLRAERAFFESVEAPAGSPTPEELALMLTQFPLIKQNRPDMFWTLIHSKFHQKKRGGSWVPIKDVRSYLASLEAKFSR